MKLAAWLQRERLTQSEFADRIGTSQAAVARYANGIRVPRRQHMEAISRETKGMVGAADFYEPHTAPAVAVPA